MVLKNKKLFLKNPLVESNHAPYFTFATVFQVFLQLTPVSPIICLQPNYQYSRTESILVREVRLELTRYYYQQVLSLSCLPFHHSRITKSLRPRSSLVLKSFDKYKYIIFLYLCFKKYNIFQKKIKIGGLDEN